MRVELLYFDGCPSHASFLPRLRALIEHAGVAADVELRRIDTVEAAQAERFLRSPTVRVDGCDIEPGAGERTDYGLKCRVYPAAGTLQGIPLEEHVVAALTDTDGTRDVDADRAG